MIQPKENRLDCDTQTAIQKSVPYSTIPYSAAANDHGRAIDALYAIPADLPRDEWVKAGMAAQAAGLDFDVFDAWSALGGNYDACAARDTWRSFTPGKGVGAGTLYHMAAAHGWNTHVNKPQQGPRKVVEPPRKPAPGATPSAVWNRAEPASAEHGYIRAKGACGAPLDGLRVLPVGDPLRIAGQSLAGALVVPAYAADGTMQSLQLIPPPGAGKKLNLSGCPMTGASFTVGNVVPGAPLYICEGIGTAWACWTATGHAAVVCFGWGNVGKIAAQLRQRDATARLVLVPDAGKEQAAVEIAREHQCSVAYMPEGEAQNFDAGDLAQRDGADVLADLLRNAVSTALLQPVSVIDVLTRPSPAPRFVWEGYIPRGVVTLFSAHGGTGKSYVALMLAVATAVGRPLFGKTTEQCPVVFASLEDGAGIVRYRLATICKAWDIAPEALHGCLHIVDGTEYPELFAADGRGPGDATAAYHELRKLAQTTSAGLVIVDNASDAYGGDEIQRRQVRAFMRILARIARDQDAGVMLLAHVDKTTSRARKSEGGEGYSGSTAWHNSARSRLFMVRNDDGTLTLNHEKGNHAKGLQEPLTLTWPKDGLPDTAQSLPPEVVQRLQGRADDQAAIALLRLVAEYADRSQYMGTALTARNNPHAVLKADPTFKRLRLSREDVQRIVTQCQRAGWLSITEYRTHDRKNRDRWTVTPEGRDFADIAPSAPSAPSMDESADGAESAGGAPSAPSCVGGTGESARAQEGADLAALADCE